MTHHDTTPTAEERRAALEFLGDGTDRCVRMARAYGFLVGTVTALTDADTPDEARLIARGRAMADAYEEDPR